MPRNRVTHLLNEHLEMSGIVLRAEFRQPVRDRSQIFSSLRHRDAGLQPRQHEPALRQSSEARA